MAVLIAAALTLAAAIGLVAHFRPPGRPWSLGIGLLAALLVHVAVPTSR